jgi:hypothetical protein
MFVYFQVKVIDLVTWVFYYNYFMFRLSEHSRHVCLHSVRIAAIFVYFQVKVINPVTWVCLHSVRIAAMFVYFQVKVIDLVTWFCYYNYFMFRLSVHSPHVCLH